MVVGMMRRKENPFCDSDGSPRCLDLVDAMDNDFAVRLVNPKLKDFSKVLLDGAAWRVKSGMNIWSYGPCVLHGIMVLELETDVARERARERWTSGERR